MSEPRVKVLFVCRGSMVDGLGHLTRCCTLARVMRHIAKVKLAVIGDETGESVLSRAELDYVIIRHDTEVLAVRSAFEPDVVIIDFVHLEDAVFQTLRETAMIVGLSPICDYLDKIDVLFHRTAVFGPSWPRLDHGPIVRAGLAYAIVGEHCRRIPEQVYQQYLTANPLSVAISMGGADAANKTLEVLRAVKRIHGSLLFWVLLGEGYAHSYRALVDMLRGSPHEIVLAKTNESMWRVLNMCSLAILAGGTTTYEAAFAGLPSINTLETSEHVFLVDELVQQGVCVCLGQTFPQSLGRLVGVLGHLIVHRDELLTMHTRSHGLIDGRGAQRIAQELLAFYQHHKRSAARNHTTFREAALPAVNSL